MAQKQTGKIAALLAALVVVLSAMLIGINVVTGPIIESNGASAAFAPLFAVMPDAENFEEVTATLSDVPASVIAVYKETSGKGYVVRAKASSQYSKDPMEMTFGVGADGKICACSWMSTPKVRTSALDSPAPSWVRIPPWPMYRSLPAVLTPPLPLRMPLPRALQL